MQSLRNSLTFTALAMTLLCASEAARAQGYSEAEILQGYRHEDATTVFLFSAELYGLEPEKVTVTGSFRGWSQDMDEEAWALRKSDGGLWTLEVANEGFQTVPASAQFKFRVDEGEWLSPPAGATNVGGGNLVFMQGIAPPSLKAEIAGERAIWAYVGGIERPLDPEGYRLTNYKGEEIPIAEVLPNTDTKTLVVPAEPIDPKRVHSLEIPAEGLKTACRFDAWFATLYSDKPLGAEVAEDGSRTAFRVFSPRAEGVKLYLYKGKDDEDAYETLDMERDSQGVWEAFVEGDLKGTWYDFTVHGPAEEKGSHFYESNPVHVSDPYARVSDDTWGKCRVWHKTEPAAPLAGGIPALQDVIAYEVHVQDFTDLLPVSPEKRGTLPAMMEKGLRNRQGEAVGFDYLADLGVNVVHLMPVQEFLHYPDMDWAASFKDDPYMRENGIAEENYQWGYRTSHCFAVETRYRGPGAEPGEEREQFRDLVQAFHEKDMAVIIDIVPNHTAENMDVPGYFFHFNVFGKQYYYRTDQLEHIGEYGNEVKTENRPMTQRWLIDQCRHWIEEFGIDGFRIDLAGQVDQQTLIKLRKALGPDVIVYGEPWIGSNDPEFEANPAWDWYKADSPICFFQDDARNAFKGPAFFDPEGDPEKTRGYAGGDLSMRERVKKGLTCTFPEETSPLSGINYLDIHDNWALADQFATEDWDGRKGVEETRFKIAAVLLYTSLGPIVTHGGTEIMRSKGAAVLGEVVKETKGGLKVYLHGKRDTYNMREANRFHWENVGRSKRREPDYAGMHAFWRGLNRFRLSEAGAVFRQAEAVPEGYYEFIEPKEEGALGYIADGKVFVLMNVGQEAYTFKNLLLPPGQWKLVGSPEGFDHENGVRVKDKALNSLEGGKLDDVEVPAPGFYVWLKQ